MANSVINHSTLMLAALMIGVQRAISLVTRAPSACGPRFDLSGISQPSWMRRLRTFSSSSAFASASARRSITGFGASFGANRPFQADASNCGQTRFFRCRHAGKRRAALRRCDRIALRGAARNVRNCVWNGVADVIHLSSKQCIHGRCGAIERHEGWLHTDERMEQQAGHVRDRADACVRHVHRRGIGFEVKRERVEIAGRKILSRGEHDW